MHFLFLSHQSGVGPSISSSVVQCSIFLLVCISVPVLAVYFCPSSVRVVATFSGTVLFPLLCSVLPFFPLIHWFFSLSSFVIPSKCLKNFICAASKRCFTLFFSTQASLPNFNLAVMLWILNFVSLFICFPKCLRIAPFILLYWFVNQNPFSDCRFKLFMQTPYPQSCYFRSHGEIIKYYRTVVTMHVLYNSSYDVRLARKFHRTAVVLHSNGWGRKSGFDTTHPQQEQV